MILAATAIKINIMIMKISIPFSESMLIDRERDGRKYGHYKN